MLSALEQGNIFTPMSDHKTTKSLGVLRTGGCFSAQEPASPELRLSALHSIEKTMQLSATYKQVDTMNRCLMRDSTERGTMNC